MNADQKSIETTFPIAICRPIGDNWQSKTLFLAISDPRSSIVMSVFDCFLNRTAERVHKRRAVLEQSVKQLLEGLKMFNGTSLTLSSVVDQEAYGNVTKTQDKNNT